MRIESIDVYLVALPLRQPQPNEPRAADKLETVIVRLGGGGASGWGEASPGNSPRMHAEWAAGAFACLRDWLAPALVGADLPTGKDLQDRLGVFRGNQFAKSALDAAWWDLKARLENRPLHQVLGGTRSAVELGVSFDRMDTIDELLAKMKAAFEAGFSRVELKIRPGWDVHMLNIMRHEFPVETVHGDFEGALRLNHMEMLCRMDDFHLAMIEQPLAPDDLVGHAMVQETIRTPVCLDEGVATLEQADMALELHSGQYVNVKPGRVGGITPAVAIHDACHEKCTPCFVGAMPQTAIGSRAGLALASKANFTYPTDYVDSASLFTEDLAPPAVPARDPADGKLRIALWSEPGLGVEPDQKLLDQFTLRKVVLK